jgi:putative FmdB family regulatory protein
MPIYEYRCSTCGYQKEYLQKVSAPRLTDCPECGKPTFDKLLSAAGFQLKGSGWYVTDFRNNGAKPKTAESAKSDAAKSDTAKSDTAKSDSAEPKKEEKKPDSAASAAPAST